MATRLDWTAGQDIGAFVARDLFGGNILFDRDRLGADGTYDDVAMQLGLTHVRYPGGSIAEWMFDITDPNATRGWHPEKNEWRDLMPLSAFLAWAGEAEVAVDLVIPTRSLMVGPDGDQRPSDSAYDDIRTYVIDVLSGRYGTAHIDTIELGNEYWLAAGLNVVEYIRIADVMARATQDAIDTVRARGLVPEDWEEPEIAVQVGQKGLHSADMEGWPQNQKLMAELSDAAVAAIDAVVVHYYTRQGFDELPDFDYYFDRLDDWPEFGRFDGIEYHVSEWGTQFNNTEEYGLRQASTMIWMVSQMVARGVDQAHVWPVQQNTTNDLSGDEGQSALTLAGEGFRLMAESLPELELERRLDFDGGVGYLYGSAEQTVVLLTSRQQDAQSLSVELPGDAGRGVQMVRLGTDGDPNDPDALPRIVYDADLRIAGGQVDVDLDAYEIVRLVASQTPPAGYSGSAGPDILRGGGWSEVLDGLDGDDRIDAGSGDDTVTGGAGHDSIDGGAGQDWIDAGPGDDTVSAGPGNDTVDLGDGNDRFDDSAEGRGSDKVFGGAGDDLLRGGAGDDGLSGGEGNDTVEGGRGSDTVLGLEGDDRLRGGQGADDIDGGVGQDDLDGGPGHDRIAGGAGDDSIFGERGQDTLLGQSGDDLIYGHGGDDLLSGDTGDDMLSGGDGSDTLAPGDGTDTLTGGAGADVFVFDRDDSENWITDFDRQDRIDLRGQGLDLSDIAFGRDGATATLSFAGTDIVLSDAADFLSPEHLWL